MLWKFEEQFGCGVKHTLQLITSQKVCRDEPGSLNKVYSNLGSRNPMDFSCKRIGRTSIGAGPPPVAAPIVPETNAEDRNI
jgi:hypothetical protein